MNFYRNFGVCALYFSVLFLNGCVEHTFSFSINPEGSYDFSYKAHGDRQDLLDFDFPVPLGENWKVVSTLEGTEVETYDYLASRSFKDNQDFPQSFFSGDSVNNESLVKHQIDITASKRFFYTSYSITAIFKSRGIEDKYPKILGLLENADDPPKGWTEEVFRYLIAQTLVLCDVGFNREPLIKQELDTWLNENIAIQPDTNIFNNFDQYKSEGLKIIKQQLEPEFSGRVDSIFQMLEQEANITIDLVDDSFKFLAVLPGDLEVSNSDTTLGDTLTWNFSIKDFADKNYKIKAASIIKYPQRIKGIWISLIIMAGITIISLWWKKRK